MRRFRPEIFIGIGELLGFAKEAHQAGTTGPADGKRALFLAALLLGQKEMFQQLDKDGFKATLRAGENAIDELNNASEKGMSCEKLYMLADEYYRHLWADCEDHVFLFLEPDRVPFYERPQVLVQAAIDAFPSAEAELQQATRCYALDLPTACVFHAMRSVEKPIQALANDIGWTLSKGIDLATWGDIYREVDKKIIALRNTPHTSQRDDILAAYSEANKEFGYFKEAWRNFVSHGRGNYDSPQAFSALNHVISFIERLSAYNLREKP